MASVTQQILLSIGNKDGVNFNVSLPTSIGGNNGYTYVVKITAAGLTLPSGSISRMRFTFQGGTPEGYIVTNAYIGHRAGSGDAYDFATTPTQILFSGGASGNTGVNTTITSDWVNFAYDKTSDLVIAFYGGGGTGADTFKYGDSITGVQSYYKLANEAATVNKTGYTSAAAGRSFAVTEIESDGF